MVEPITSSGNPVRSVDRVAGKLRAQILAGLPPAGAYLPAERQLAVQLGVNRLTLRAALARLQAEGLVEPRQGAGILVRPLRLGATLEVLPHLFEGRSPPLVRAFLELRRTIAAEAVALAATRATEEQLTGLDALALAQESEQDPAAFAVRDLAFGRAVLGAAGNLAFELLLNSVEKSYAAAPWLHEALHGNREAVRASYGAVVALLRARDPALARETIREALTAIDEAALARLEGEPQR